MSNITYYRFACLLPVAKNKDSPDAVQLVPLVTLATDVASAQQLAADAGLTFVGIIDMDGNVRPIQPPST